jgi:hypothetical protein
LSDPASSTEVEPFSGTRRFRRTARMCVRDGALVATDRRGRTFSFPMDGTPQAPARFVVTFASEERDGHGRFAYLDGSGQAIIRGLNHEWNHFEQMEFNDAAGIAEGLANPPLPPLRHDGCAIEDVKWADVKYLYIAAVLGGAIAFALASDVIPTWLGWSVLAPILVLVVAVLLSGVTATPRDFEEFRRRTAEELDRAAAPPRRAKRKRQ